MSHHSATSLTVAYRGFLKGVGHTTTINYAYWKKFFQVVKKGLHFESVLVLSIFLPKILVISKRKGLHFESVSDFSY